MTKPRTPRICEENSLQIIIIIDDLTVRFTFKSITSLNNSKMPKRPGSYAWGTDAHPSSQANPFFLRPCRSPNRRPKPTRHHQNQTQRNRQATHQRATRSPLALAEASRILPSLQLYAKWQHRSGPAPDEARDGGLLDRVGGLHCERCPPVWRQQLDVDGHNRRKRAVCIGSPAQKARRNVGDMYRACAGTWPRSNQRQRRPNREKSHQCPRPPDSQKQLSQRRYQRGGELEQKV